MTLKKPDKPYEAFRKIICSLCQSVHTFALKDDMKRLPDDIPCGICRQPMRPNRHAERREQRHPVDVGAVIISPAGASYDIKLLDLSRGGARFESKTQLPAEPALTFKTNTFSAEGEIVWVTKHSSVLYEAGFAFNEVRRDEPFLLVDVRR